MSSDMTTTTTTTTPDQRAIAVSAIHLMQGVVYQESDGWADLQRHRGALRDHFGVVGLDVVINEDEGFAYLRTKDTPDGEDPLPRVIRRHELSYGDSVLAVLLRKRMVEFEASGDQGKLVLTTEQIVEMLELFLPRSTDEARLVRSVETSINRLVALGYLRQLKGEKGMWEVRRILKAYVDAQTLGDFAGKLAEYEAEAAADAVEPAGGPAPEPAAAPAPGASTSVAVEAAPEDGDADE